MARPFKWSRTTLNGALRVLRQARPDAKSIEIKTQGLHGDYDRFVAWADSEQVVIARTWRTFRKRLKQAERATYEARVRAAS